MDPSYRALPSFHSNALPPHPSFILASQHAVPAQEVQQQLPPPIFTPQSHAANLVQYGTLSLEQRAAVAALQEIPIPVILDWLEGIRSFVQGEQRFNPNQLSREQYHAISILIRYSNETVQAWLNIARSASTLDASQNNFDSISSSSGRAAGNFAQSSSSFIDASICCPPWSPGDQESYNPSRDASVGLQSSSAATFNDYDRWCFICEDSTGPAIKTLDGFRRHVREHHTRYYCIPPEPLVYTEDGPSCRYCGMPNPNAIHLNTHNIPGCVGKRFTRKKTLMKHHEKKHSAHSASVLAQHSEFTVNKKYFACGFCIFFCGSLNELVTHIDVAHYKFLEHIRDWDPDKVILGLLSQPIVNEYWRAILAANPHIQGSWLTWNPVYVKQLQHRLEMSQEPAAILCTAAISQSNYGLSQNGHVEREHALSPQHYLSEQSSSTRGPLMATPTLQSPDRPNGSDWGASYENWSTSRVTPDAHGSPASAMYHHADYGAQSCGSPSSDENFVQHQHAAYESSLLSASGMAQAFGGRVEPSTNPNLGRHPPGMSPSFSLTSRPRQLVKTHTLPLYAHASYFHPTLASQPTLSPLSGSHQASPSTDLDTACNHRHRPTLAAGYSHQDTDSDSDNQQRFVQAQGRSRRQRRKR